MGKKAKIKVVTGNEAAAIGASLCRPDVIAAYPITPQSEVVEKLSEYHANGLLDCEMINVEGENSAMNSITAASLAGGRVFTATSSWGLVFMYDAILATAGSRAPVVMANVNRETPGIIAVSCGQQDMISVRDSGWILLIAEDCQEILDMLIMAYRLAEDHEIQLPVMVNYDGFYLSFLSEKIEIPDIEQVDTFLSVLKKQPQRPKLLPGKSLGCGSHGILGGYLELRYKHCIALEKSKNKFEEITKDYEKEFSRYSGGQIEEYKIEDAETVIVASGSMCGTIKTVIDKKRKKGIKVGLVRIKMYRPFPEEKLIQALRSKKSIGVIDRSICFGFSGGPIYIEIKTLTEHIKDSILISFIAGLANTDITVLHIEKIIDDLIDASNGKPYQKINWIPSEQEEITYMKNKKLSPTFQYLKHPDPFQPGLTFCAGCPVELLVRFIPKVLGNDIVITGTPSCSAPVLLGQNTGTWHKLAYYGTLMTGAAANATGLVRYYNRAGIDNTVICFNGDGTASDIGFGNLSGAAERNEPFIYICYDNEGYMNTGIQQSGTTPFGAHTSTTPVGKKSRGKNRKSKNLPLLMAMHDIPYAATATMSNLDDLAKKLLKAKEKKNQGFCFLHIFCPCPTGWGVATDKAIELCRMAVKTNYYPLWEADNGKFTVTYKVKNPKPIFNYTKLIKKFSHLKEDELNILQENIRHNYRLLEKMTG